MFTIKDTNINKNNPQKYHQKVQDVELIAFNTKCSDLNSFPLGKINYHENKEQHHVSFTSNILGKTWSNCTCRGCIEHCSVETNIYFGTNRISNIICLMKIEQIEYQILLAHQENIRILFKYLKIFEYSNKFEKKCKGFGIQNFYIPQKHLLIRKNFPHVDSHQ